MQKSARRLVQAADVCVLDDGLIHGAMPRFGVEGAETTQEGRRWWESNPHTLIYFPPRFSMGPQLVSRGGCLSRKACKTRYLRGFGRA